MSADNGQLIPALMTEIGNIGKGRKADLGGKNTYQYRGIDDVMNELGPAMAKVGLRMNVNYQLLHRERFEEENKGSVRQVYNAEVLCRLEVLAPDGEVLCRGEGLGSGTDNRDKHMMKAGSVAYREAVCKMLAIAFHGEYADPESDNTPVGGRPVDDHAGKFERLKADVNAAQSKKRLRELIPQIRRLGGDEGKELEELCKERQGFLPEE